MSVQTKMQVRSLPAFSRQVCCAGNVRADGATQYCNSALSIRRTEQADRIGSCPLLVNLPKWACAVTPAIDVATHEQTTALSASLGRLPPMMRSDVSPVRCHSPRNSSGRRGDFSEPAAASVRCLCRSLPRLLLFEAQYEGFSTDFYKDAREFLVSTLPRAKNILTYFLRNKLFNSPRRSHNLPLPFVYRFLSREKIVIFMIFTQKLEQLSRFMLPRGCL